ncbi:chromosome segregation protein SMC [Tunicatimonas pelagia]|uniref:chromosome segregation protein SMC n=1 Tax=Tunicatimonas pelagia TaxID=931531 RepID=UPI002666566F|nr:chromosome segregation protein SMC [Tunicatimonas pelagia]WKN42345.1 chromosome segregation protein SMC [Tunicatimonas pelagia]
MQLSTLELKGFKSFGDKVTIRFDRGITGIVGPNGCGKSNVVDAIRWVLGEQKSRMLRSDKMENIIFNGTKKRKATQLAEVSLTFDNTRNLLPTEYTQVTITRRYYRSGDSEYLLNGVPCRLKDIVTLFMDTGIASNSYAIIELKMVDDILNDKDGSRRALFEEAAGVSKFRIRKKETLRKLRATDDDLDRVEDLLFEIEKNLKSLERQAKQAERYYKAKEEYKELSITLAKSKVRASQEASTEAKQQLDNETDRKVQLSRQVDEQEATLAQLKTDLVQKEQLLASRQKTLNEHVATIRNAESDKQVKNERLKFLQDRKDRLNALLKQDRETVDLTAEHLEKLQWEKASAVESLEQIQQQVTELEEEHRTFQSQTRGLKDEVAEADDVAQEQQERVYQLQKQLEIKQMQLNATRLELEKSTENTSARNADLTEFDQKAVVIREQIEEREQQLEDTEQQEAELQDRIVALIGQIEQTKEEITALNRQQDALQNEYNLTKSLVDNLEGFPEAIKFLKKNVDWAKKAPLLSDVVTCPEQYRVCIENYLGPYMNYFVVDSRAQALEAIQLLGDAAQGKAHFFLLDELQQFVPQRAESTMGDNAKPALNVVEYDTKYQRLIQFLLNEVYVTNLPDLSPQETYSLITADGQVVQQPFRLSGGSVGLFEGKRLGRAKNLEKLKEDLGNLKQQIGDKQAFLLEQQQQVQQLRQQSYASDLIEIQRNINRLQQDYATFASKKEQLSEMLSSQAQQQDATLVLIAQLEEEVELVTPQLQNSEQQLQLAKERQQQLNSQLAVENEQLSEKSAAFNQEKIRYFQQESTLKSLSQEITFKEESHEKGIQNIAKNQQELEVNTQNITDLLNSNDVGEDELLAMYDEKQAIEAGVNEAERDYYAYRGNIDKSEQAIRDLQRSRSQQDTLIMELQNQLNSIQLELTSIQERLSVEFDLDAKELLTPAGEEEVQPTDEELEAMNTKLEKIRERIRKIGPINPMAMEAYDEIKQRYDFISSERNDLLQAKDSLMTTIGEIDAVARETFMAAFEQIRENFIRVFRTLFTEEDDCELKLADPDNPLDSSIEIMARPKGKRPLTINQLSGGEKTLTATSLLFAIYLLKPAPFCIFDEVDAPLDDANIDKFNNIIKEFSSESQFIIVTHNKRTMASTDVIYGVTMIEQGVSRVVPVDLRETVSQ